MIYDFNNISPKLDKDSLIKGFLFENMDPHIPIIHQYPICFVQAFHKQWFLSDINKLFFNCLRYGPNVARTSPMANQKGIKLQLEML